MIMGTRIGSERTSRRPVIPGLGVLALAVVIGASGCAAAASTTAASTYRKVSLYRSAAAYAPQASDEVFDSAAKLLLDRDDIDITDLNEAHRQCTAVAGDRTLTLRVINAGPGRSRISLLVGGIEDDAGSQALADGLLEAICSRLAVPCEWGTRAP